MRVLACILSGIVSLVAASQSNRTFFKNGDQKLQLEIEQALRKSRLTILKSEFYLIGLHIKNRGAISVVGTSQDTSGNFQYLRDALLTTKRGWTRRRRQRIILFPFFLIQVREDAPIITREWDPKESIKLRSKRMVLFEPIYILGGYEQKR